MAIHPALMPGTLRTRLLLSLMLISALLTSGVLAIVQYRVRVHAREEITQALRDAVVRFQNLQEQRETALSRTAALLATLPPLKAMMTSEDPATIQDASAMFWNMTGSQLLALADRSGRLVALHSATPAISPDSARAAIARTLSLNVSRDWWFANGRLYEVFVEPIYFGAPEDARPIGTLAVGYEIDPGVAADISGVAASEVAFGYDGQVVATTMPSAARDVLARYLTSAETAEPSELQLDDERFLATSMQLSSGSAPRVTLSILKSVDQATAFLRNLNRWILGIGIVAVIAGGSLAFLVSTTFTRPLARLVSGVRALEHGDYAYPLDPRGDDEVSTVTAAFVRMRDTLGETQRRLVESEQLATIGRMASTISHDLRHPLTSILAYAEFLSERDLNEAQRKDFFQEIRIAVNRMLDEINSLLGFSKEQEALTATFGRADVVIDRAIRTVKALPEFDAIAITLHDGGGCVGWFDPAKLERVMLNLILNAAEAVPPDSGRIDVSCRTTRDGTEIRVADNGPGIPESIADTLFRPFVSYGKQKGIGLGLTIVQTVMRQHNGDVTVARTGPEGTVFRLFFPTPDQSAASQIA